MPRGHGWVAARPANDTRPSGIIVTECRPPSRSIRSTIVGGTK